MLPRRPAPRRSRGDGHREHDRGRDNGPGIAGDVVDDILDFTVRVSSREAYVGPTRGAQGNALKTLWSCRSCSTASRPGRDREPRHPAPITFAIDRIAQEPRVEITASPLL